MDSDAEVAIPEGTIVLEKYRVVRTLGIGGMGTRGMGRLEVLAVGGAQ